MIMTKRLFKRPIKRIVVKLGSTQIADFALKPRTAQINALAKQIIQLHERNIEVVLVSSGAIVLGMGELGQKKRPTEVAALQARAAIGQAVLMRVYSALFSKAGLKCAQVLLTWDDFDNRERFLNARHTLDAILKVGAIPVINENDTVATDEIKFGDNDQLSAMVASCVHADLLIILSDVDGLYDANKKVFNVVHDITQEIRAVAGGAKDAQISRGGMATKLDAVRIATHAHVPVVITNGAIKDVLVKLVDGENIGTLFMEKEDKLLARKHWIAFSAKPKGFLIIDDGAVRALNANKSLLFPGIVDVEGHFKVDDVVALMDNNGHLIAKGLCQYNSTQLTTKNLSAQVEVVHRDSMVLMGAI